MLTPEQETLIRKFVDRYRGSDRTVFPAEPVALLLEEIDQLRLQVATLEGMGRDKQSIEETEGLTDG